MLPADLADGAVAVGTDGSCDWQIAAEDVPALAFYLKAIAGSLFVRAAGPAELRVDGHGVGSIWVPVERGARITIGAAQIEVGLAGRSRHAQHALLERAFDAPGELGGEAVVVPGAIPASALPVPSVPFVSGELLFGRGAPAHEQPLYEQPADEPHALAHASPRAPLYEPRASEEPLHEQPAADLQMREGLVASEQLWSATIFGAEELRAAGAFAADTDDDPGTYIRGWGSAGLWIAGSLVACAYGCWVLLLDYF